MCEAGWWYVSVARRDRKATASGGCTAPILQAASTANTMQGVLWNTCVWLRTASLLVAVLQFLVFVLERRLPDY